VAIQADVIVGVNETRDHPALGRQGPGMRQWPLDALTIMDPEIANLSSRKHDAADVQVLRRGEPLTGGKARVGMVVTVEMRQHLLGHPLLSHHCSLIADPCWPA